VQAVWQCSGVLEFCPFVVGDSFAVFIVDGPELYAFANSNSNSIANSLVGLWLCYSNPKRLPVLQVPERSDMSTIAWVNQPTEWILLRAENILHR
jgi:hypothetical protein